MAHARTQTQTQMTEPEPEPEPEVAHVAHVMDNQDGLAIALCIFPIGGRHDPPVKEGLCHLVEHMCFLKHKNFFDFIHQKAINASSNAATSPDYTYFHVHGPAGNREQIMNALKDLAFDLETSIMDIDDHEFQREHQVVVEELRLSNAREDSHIASALLSDLESVRGVYDRPIVGTEKSVFSITKQDAQEFYKSKLLASDFKVVVNIDSNHTKDVRSALASSADWQEIARRRPKPHDPSLLVVAQNGSRVRDIVQSVLLPWKSRMKVLLVPDGLNQVAIGFPSVSAGDKLARALDILAFSLGGGFTSVLYRILRSILPITYKIDIASDTRAEDGYFLFKYSTSFPTTGAIIELILKTLTQVPQIISQKEFELFRARYVTQLQIQNITPMSHTINVAEMLVTREVPTSLVEEYANVSYASYVEACNAVLSMDRVHVYLRNSESSMLKHKSVLSRSSPHSGRSRKVESAKQRRSSQSCV